MIEKPSEKMMEEMLGGFNELSQMGEELFNDDEVEKMIGEPYPNEEDAKVINGRQT